MSALACLQLWFRQGQAGGLHTFIDENSTDHNKIIQSYQATILAKKEELSFPNYHDKSKLADDIGGFFVRRKDRIRSDIDAVDIDPSVRNALPPNQEVDAAHAPHSFQPSSENDFTALIHKSCQLDPMPTFLRVGCLDVLLPVISRVINLSLLCGHFSDG